jgi:RimJ/RimL family protein N-acetyltransferase
VPYRIETERLLLRCWDPADAAELAHATIGEQDWFTFAPWVAKIQSLEEAQAFTRASRGLFDLMRDFAFSAWTREPRRLVGGAQLHFADTHARRVTVDYWLRRDAAGHGYAREAAAAVVDVALHRARAQRVEILVAVNNAKSRAVPAALGFHKEGVMRRSMLIGDRAVDLVMYALLETDHVTPSVAPAAVAAADTSVRG